VNEGGFHFLWITDFPLFEAVVDGNPIPAHHPFTMPHPDDIEMLETAQGDEWLDIRSQAYDLTLNGWELGSGSIRIFQSHVQEKILSCSESVRRSSGPSLDSCSTRSNSELHPMAVSLSGSTG